MAIYSTIVPNKFAEENAFPGMGCEQCEPPSFSGVRNILPSPIWPQNPVALECYWKAWELAFKNLRAPKAHSGFVANFIDTAFNDCTFLWDSCFMTIFGRYGSRAFNFQRTLDNFYAKQQKDGFICREIAIADGEERFQRFDPASTGPNIMPWAEWEYFKNFADKKRLARVFPALMAIPTGAAKTAHGRMVLIGQADRGPEWTTCRVSLKAIIQFLNTAI